MSDHNPFATPTVQHDVATAQYPGYENVDFEALRKTGIGLGLIYAALVLMVLIGILGGVLGATGRASVTAMPLFNVLGIIGTVTGLASIVGSLLCVTVPRLSGAKGLIIASVCLQLAQWLFAFAPRFMGALYLTSGLGVITGIVLPVVSTLLFMLFLNRLAHFIAREDFASRAKRVLILQGIGVSAGLVLSFTASGLSLSRLRFAGARSGSLSMVLVVGVGLYAIVVFLMYANIINAIGKAIRNPQKRVVTSHLG